MHRPGHDEVLHAVYFAIAPVGGGLRVALEIVDEPALHFVGGAGWVAGGKGHAPVQVLVALGVQVHQHLAGDEGGAHALQQELLGRNALTHGGAQNVAHVLLHGGKVREDQLGLGLGLYVQHLAQVHVEGEEKNASKQEKDARQAQQELALQLSVKVMRHAWVLGAGSVV